MARRRVEVAAEQPVYRSHQDPFVLLAQEGVGKGVGRSLAVGEALADDSPVAVHVHEREELGQPEEA